MSCLGIFRTSSMIQPYAGSTHGVGESGSGKSTLAKCVVNLETPTKGTITFNGTDVLKVFKSRNRTRVLALHREMQYIFQNPYASLDTRMTVADIIMEPLEVHKHIPRSRWTSTLYELLK